MVSRNIAIALGIICIVFIAGLGGAFAYYVNDRNNTIFALSSQISDKNSQISGLNATVASLQNQVDDLTDIISMNKSEVVDSTSYHVLKFVDLPATWSFQTIVGDYVLDYNCGRYAEYVAVQVLSTSNDTYVRRTISFNGIIFDNQIDVGTDGTALFPVLPAKGGGFIDYSQYLQRHYQSDSKRNNHILLLNHSLLQFLSRLTARYHSFLLIR